MARLHSWTAALALGLAPVGLLGQAGDRRNEPASEQERLWEDIDVPPAPALPPDQALETFHLEPGFRIELVASEPMVEDPIAVTWDEAGRMWVVEMQSFMPNADGEGEDEPISRIMVLEDLDGDGAMDRSTPFLEGLVMPRAIAIVESGVLVAEPPGLYYCQDLDGDLRCDKKTKVADYAATGNVEHSENGLLRGIDNWLYNAKSNRRLKFDPAKGITVEPTNSGGQWGLTMDDYGRLFYNHNSAYLLADLIPWEFAAQNPILRPSAGFDVDPVKSREVFSARVNPGVNRAYRDNWLRDDYRLWKVTGVSGLAINRGVRYPKEYYGNVFVPEVTANAVARLTLEDEGLSVSAEHPLTEHPDWDKVEFLTSTDERFRPVSAAMGPDGFIYIVDMYRGIVQHRVFLTTYLREQSEARGLVAPVGLGRIYRIVHESSSTARESEDLGALSDVGLVARLKSENGWIRDTAQRLLVERAPELSKESIKALRAAASAGGELERIHVLWTLEGAGALDESTLVSALEGGSDWVAAHVWQLSGSFLREADKDGALWHGFREALRSGEPRSQLHALQQVRRAAEDHVLIDLLLEVEANWSDGMFSEALLANLAGREMEFLLAISRGDVAEAYKPVVSRLAEAWVRARDGAALTRALSSKELDEGLSFEILDTLKSAMESERFRPINADPNGRDAMLARQAEVAKGIVSSAFVWTEEGAAGGDLYSEQEREQIARGEAVYRMVCAACHGDDGEGRTALAPTLAGSRWVTGSESVLSLIVAQGLTGPIEVAGEQWDLVMPGHLAHPLMGEERLADVLSYIRSAWGNEASTISSEDLKDILSRHPGRVEPWTVEELENEGLR